MRSKPDTLTTHIANTLAGLTDSAKSLFGADAFSTRSWYQATIEAALPPDTTPLFLTMSDNKTALAVFPMFQDNTTLSSLTTPYTSLWHPILAPNLPTKTLERIGQLFAQACRQSPVTRLDCLDPDNPALASLITGIRSAGLYPLTFDHFANWHAQTTTWDAYLSTRPGQLRQTIRRRTRRLMQTQSATFTLVANQENLGQAIEDYETIYAASWKQPEPHPNFNATLIKHAATDKTLRLGLLHLDNKPIAAQLWLVHTSWAGLLKLAHDESQKSQAPGTVLTALMIEHILNNDQTTDLDFGRGDDDYKHLWTTHRRQRTGLLLADPKSPQRRRRYSATPFRPPAHLFQKNNVAIRVIRG